MKLDRESKARISTFGKQPRGSLSVLDFRVPIRDHFFISFKSSVVDINVSLLIGLDVMKEPKFIVNVEDNVLLSNLYGWKIHFIRKIGHIYILWPSDILYTSAELTRTHIRFLHPNPDRVFSVMKRAEDPDATPETLRESKKITFSCDIFQRLEKEPSSIRVAPPSEDISFNRPVGMNLMKIESRKVLHIVDKDILFSTVCFVSDTQTSKEVWNAYKRI